MLIGLLGKNAILIVEFAELKCREGLGSAFEAVVEAARLRLPADPDDVVRVHRRPVAAGLRDRRGRDGNSHDRHRDSRWHADRHASGASCWCQGST